MTPALDQLISMVDEGFDGRAWHGPTLRGSLRGVGAPAALWRPTPGRHNIWELALHAAYWKHMARRRLTGDKRGSFGLKGSNWFDVDERTADTSERAWRAAVRLLEHEHEALRAAIASTTNLMRRVRGRHTAAYTIRGIAAHDLYHAGQIGLLKRLQKRA